jgi:hypothetical protein
LKRPNPGLIVVLAAAAAVHLTVAVMDFPTLARNGFLYDDSFYDFQIARHIVRGDGPTFDGARLTNGFQPLYVALLVPVFWLSGSSDTVPVHLALVFSALLCVATAYILYRILARRVSEAAAIVAAGAWSFSPIVMRQTANGLETALAVFMLAATLLYYLERIRTPADPPARSRFVALGALAGGAILARADLAFFVLAMCLDYLLVLRSRGAHARWRGDVAAAAGTCALAALPWIVYGVVAVGSPLPESGPATRFLAMAYAPFFGLGEASMADHGPTASFVAAHFLRSIETLKVTPAFHPLFRATRKLGEHVDQAAAMELFADVVGVLLLLAFVVWWRRRRRTTGRGGREFEFLLLFAGMMIAAYSSIVFGVFFFLRYYYPLYFVGMIFAALAMDDAIAWVRARSLHARRAALVACGVYAAGFLFMGYNSAFRSTPVYRFYDVARWVRTHTDASETIGAFQSGAIGYLSGRRVINLDGKVNRDALAALRAGHMADYVVSAGIDLVMDSSNVLNLFLGPWSDADGRRLEAERVFTGGEYGVPGWIGYRVSPPRVFNAGSPTGAGSRMQPDRQP